MSHGTSGSGRPYVACDDPIANSVTGELNRCGRRTFGRRDRNLLDGPELRLWDLPRDWRVTPYPDDFDHGATRRNLLDGTPIEPIPLLVGLFGDLHTCPACYRRMERAA